MGMEKHLSPDKTNFIKALEESFAKCEKMKTEYECDVSL